MSASVFAWTIGVTAAVAVVPALVWLVARRGRWLLLVSAVGCAALTGVVLVDAQPRWVALPFLLGAAVIGWLWRDERPDAQVEA